MSKVFNFSDVTVNTNNILLDLIDGFCERDIYNGKWYQCPWELDGDSNNVFQQQVFKRLVMKQSFFVL